MITLCNVAMFHTNPFVRLIHETSSNNKVKPIYDVLMMKPLIRVLLLVCTPISRSV